MTKKTTHSLPALKNEIVGNLSLTLPPLKIKTAGTVYPSPKEEKEYSQAFDEAVALSQQKDKRKAIEAEIEKIESYTPKNPRESLDKGKSLKAAQQRLKSLSEPKRLNQRHKLKVRDIAKNIWQKHPDWTIQTLTETNEVNEATTPRVYDVRTLRNWIKDLAPNRLPGRRKSHL